MESALNRENFDKKRIEVIITGRVQMVMFRDFTRRTARKLELVGTVENCSDGSVRVIAEGERENLKVLIERLHKGSILAKVKNVEVEWQEVSENSPENFTILYS